MRPFFDISKCRCVVIFRRIRFFFFMPIQIFHSTFVQPRCFFKAKHKCFLDSNYLTIITASIRTRVCKFNTVSHSCSLSFRVSLVLCPFLSLFLVCPWWQLLITLFSSLPRIRIENDQCQMRVVCVHSFFYWSVCWFISSFTFSSVCLIHLLICLLIHLFLFILYAGYQISILMWLYDSQSKFL